MPRQDPYRCAKCIDTTARCKRCRAKRAERKRDLYARKVADGVCTGCPARAEPGYTRCRECRLLNNALSSASHAAAVRD